MTEQERAKIRYARAFYELLENSAKYEEVDDEKFLVFRGHLSTAFQQLKVSQAYYTGIRKLLIVSGSIQILEQGNRAVPSTVVLHRPLPPPEVFAAEHPEHLTDPDDHATLSARLARVEKAVSQLEGWQDSVRMKGELNIGEALRDHELRLVDLERESQLRESNG